MVILMLSNNVCNILLTFTIHILKVLTKSMFISRHRFAPVCNYYAKAMLNIPICM